MTYSVLPDVASGPRHWSSAAPPPNPRRAMHDRLPGFVQPFLTWLTAQPAPGEPVADRSPLRFVAGASAQAVFSFESARAHEPTIEISGPVTRCDSAAAMNGSSAPSSTSPGAVETTPVRRSFTIWYGCST